MACSNCECLKLKENDSKQFELIKKEIELLKKETEKINLDITRLVHAQTEQLDLIMEDVNKVLNIVFKEDSNESE